MAAPPLRSVLPIVAASGAAALVYEIAWSRQVGLLMGQTARAAAVVLAAYFIGMAIGYGVGARWARRLQRPLWGYAAAELLAAAWVLVIPAGLAAADRSLGGLLHGGEPLLRDGARLAVVLGLLLPATVALGTTLPFVAEGLSPAGRSETPAVTRAYSWNTFGALAGVVVATGFLMLLAGVAGSSRLAAGVGAAGGLAALVVGRHGRPREVAPAATEPAGARPTQPRLWIALAALSGFTALALEVLYTHLFALVFHNSTYTFGLVLAVFLGSLAFAARQAPRLLARHDPASLSAFACGASALAAGVAVALFVLVGKLRYFGFPGGFAGYLLGAAGLVAVVTAPSVLPLGVVLPSAWHGARHLGGAGRVVGRLTAANTLAAAAGALAADFLLLPLLGLGGAFALLIGVLLVAAALLAAGRPRLRRPVAALGSAGVLVAGAVAGLPGKDRSFRTGERVVERWTSAYGIVDVVEHKSGNRRLRQNVHYGLGSTHSAPMELRQGHMPLLMHPSPRRVLFIGLATGTTASAALHHPSVEALTIVELVPDVARAARLFAETNADVLDDPRTELLIEDGRHHLRTASREYDVVVSDLFVPWESRTGYLYTVDHYAAARERLAPGGLFCQWLALWQVGPRELEIIAESFRSVFPHTSVWLGTGSARRQLIALVGSEQPLTLDVGALEERIAALPPPPVGREPLLKDAERFVRLYAGDWPATTGAPLNTDEHPRLELLAPVTHRGRAARLKDDRLRAYFDERLAGLPRSGIVIRPPLSGVEQGAVRSWQREYLVRH